MKYIIAIGIFQALAAAVMLWRNRLRNHADDLLITMVTCIGIHLSIKFCIYTFVSDEEVLSMMNTFIGFCYMPLFYLYTIKAIRPDFIPASRWYIFIPFIISAIGYFSVISVLATAPQAGHDILYWYNTITLWTLLPSDIILSFWSIHLANRGLSKASNERKMIVQVGALFLSIGLLGILFILIKPLGFSYNYAARGVIYALLILISIRVITFKYNIQAVKANDAPDVSARHIELNPPNLNLPVEITKFLLPEKRKELLTEDEMLSIVLKLETAMITERLYRDSELTLDKLSRLIQQNKYHISETLNHFLHKPFYNFINEYRIQHVKTKLENLSRKEIEVNMLTLAYDAGFNSKSSFNRYFKEMTGHTPTTYYKMISEKVEC